MAPVAGLIVVRPRVQIKTIKRDSLHANANDWHAGSHLAIEAVLVHSEIRGRIAESYESRCESESGRMSHALSFCAQRREIRRLLQGAGGLRSEAHLRVGAHGAMHSSGRHTCLGDFLEQRRLRERSSAVTVTSRDIQSRISDRVQPIGRPRNLSLRGNRPIKLSPASTHRGRRVRRATSWALRISFSGGQRSLTHGGSTTNIARLVCAARASIVDESTCMAKALVEVFTKPVRPRNEKQEGESGKKSSERHFRRSWDRRPSRSQGEFPVKNREYPKPFCLRPMSPARECPLEFVHELFEPDLQHGTEIPQLYEVQAPHTALDVTHEGLAAPERLGTLRLRDPGLDPPFLQQLQENSVLASVNRFWHGRRPGCGHERYILLSDI